MSDWIKKNKVIKMVMMMNGQKNKMIEIMMEWMNE